MKKVAGVLAGCDTNKDTGIRKNAAGKAFVLAPGRVEAAVAASLHV